MVTLRFGVAILLVAVLISIPAQSRTPSPAPIKRITVVEGEGFLLSMGNDPPNSDCCTLFRNNQKYDVRSAKTTVLVTGEQLTKVVDGNFCGFRVFGANKNSEGEWKLKNERTTCRRFEVKVISASAPVECPREASENCKLINLENQQQRECGQDTNDWTKWKCVFPYPGSLEFKVSVSSLFYFIYVERILFRLLLNSGTSFSAIKQNK